MKILTGLMESTARSRITKNTTSCVLAKLFFVRDDGLYRWKH